MTKCTPKGPRIWEDLKGSGMVWKGLTMLKGFRGFWNGLEVSMSVRGVRRIKWSEEDSWGSKKIQKV